MGLFSTLKEKIFGSPEAEEVAAKQEPAPAPVAAAPAAAAPAPKKPVDLNIVLAYMAEKKGQDLNWKTSIVDLMKLVNMDSSLANRKELAQEMGYTGALDGSAEMNIWLHKAVMAKLAERSVA